MNVLDLVLLLVVLLSVIPAIMKGFVHEVIMMSAAIVGFGLAAWKYPEAARHLTFLTSSPTGRDFAAFLLIFITTLIVAALLAKLMSGLVSAVGLRWFDRLLGAALGLVRGVLICVLLLIILTAFPVSVAAIRNSSLAPDFLSAASVLAELMPVRLRASFQSGLAQVRVQSNGAKHIASAIESD